MCRKRKEAPKKRKSKKDKKAKKGCIKMRRQLALVWWSASTQGGGASKLVPDKRGEKRTCFGPAEVVFTVGKKARFRGDVHSIAVGSL